MVNKNTAIARYIRRKIRKRWNVSYLAKIFHLSVAKQEHLRNQLIGLDAVKRKLLLVRKQKQEVDYRIVDLQDVQQVSVKKVYGSIPASDLPKKGLDYYLQSVSLHLGFKNGAEPIDVSFYESGRNAKGQQSFLEAAAKKWEGFVADLLPKTPVIAGIWRNGKWISESVGRFG